MTMTKTTPMTPPTPENDPKDPKSPSTSSEDDDDDDEWEDLLNEEEEEPSFWSELREGWRQHCVALLVAVVATFVAFYFQKSAQTSQQIELSKHSHLHGYQRTANISFCGAIIDEEAGARGDLFSMDFTLSKKYLSALKFHYAADAVEDDDYSYVFEHPPSNLKSHPQVKCLDVLEETETKIKGWTLYYKTPSFRSMYDSTSLATATTMKEPKLQPAHLTFTGFAAKFVNLSPKPLLLYWDGRGEIERRLVGEIAPFEALGTATTPGQSFSVSPIYDSEHALDRWVVTADDCIIWYEPQGVVESLTSEQLQLYQMQKLNQEFAKHYLIHSGRSWLAHFPRAFPVHRMWDATYFGQVHQVQHGDRSFSMKVESVTPRVFSIPNFLTKEECEQLILLAKSQGMKGSTVYSGSLVRHQRDLSTRSSTNTWLERSLTNLTEKIYLQASSILQIDQSLLQAPIDDDVHAHHHSIAESLQVVRYKKGEEYTAHHDFVYPTQRHRLQPTRFATLLLYLNDDFEGGQTVFPRAANAQYHDGIAITPEVGTAVLFYNMLPDGNVDDLSQHSGKPVESGEKFLANLWIWEPLIN